MLFRSFTSWPQLARRRRRARGGGAEEGNLDPNSRSEPHAKHFQPVFGRSTIRTEPQKRPMQRQRPARDSHKQREQNYRILRITWQSPTDMIHNTSAYRLSIPHTQFMTCLFRFKVLPRPWSQAFSDVLLTLQQARLIDAENHGQAELDSCTVRLNSSASEIVLRLARPSCSLLALA